LALKEAICFLSQHRKEANYNNRKHLGHLSKGYKALFDHKESFGKVIGLVVWNYILTFEQFIQLLTSSLHISMRTSYIKLNVLILNIG
jgi:hypothetical protein